MGLLRLGMSLTSLVTTGGLVSTYGGILVLAGIAGHP